MKLSQHLSLLAMVAGEDGIYNSTTSDGYHVGYPSLKLLEIIGIQHVLDDIFPSHVYKVD